MKLLRLQEPNQLEFDRAPEVAMDSHLAFSDRDPYLVIGGRVAFAYNESNLSEPHDEFLTQPWLGQGLGMDERIRTFEEWLAGLHPAPTLTPMAGNQARQSLRLAFLPVTPKGPLPRPPRPPTAIYGHLPFLTQTDQDTVIYRWEAFPASRRIHPATKPPTVAAHAYGSPASEVPFAPTGFAAVARFALPSLLPACFLWKLQPKAGTKLECGASVPLYGQSGGGVEVKFTNVTENRCPIAAPLVLPQL